jgi:hypothetical protein
MNIDKLHDLKRDLEMAALNAKLRADNAAGADNNIEKTEWRGRYTQYQKWADMLTEAIKD